MSYDWSIISGSLSKSSYQSVYSAGYNISQARSLKQAYTTLSHNATSAKNSKEAAKLNSRLATLSQSIAGSADVDPYAAFKTADKKSSRISDLAKEAGKKMYEAATGTGTVVDEEA